MIALDTNFLNIYGVEPLKMLYVLGLKQSQLILTKKGKTIKYLTI